MLDERDELALRHAKDRILRLTEDDGLCLSETHDVRNGPSHKDILSKSHDKLLCYPLTKSHDRGKRDADLVTNASDEPYRLSVYNHQGMRDAGEYLAKTRLKDVNFLH